MNNSITVFWIVLAVLTAFVILLDKKQFMLRDTSLARRKPYSFARVQLTWWTLLVLATFITILWDQGEIPTLRDSTLVLLGISAATTAAARVIDITDSENQETIRHQDMEGSANFFIDILSDEKGVSINRFQTVVINITFGVWFISKVLSNLNHGVTLDLVIPEITQNNLILLGLSSATYAGLKATENRPAGQATPPEHVPDEAITDKPAVMG